MTIDQNHICFTTASTISEISKPLFESSKLNFFSYARVFKKNNCFVFHNNNTLLENWFKLEAPAPSCWPEGVYLWDDILTDELKKLRHELNLDNGICIVNHYTEYTDIFAFNAPIGATNVVPIYLNQMNSLNRFCLYFKDQAAKLIEQALSNPIIMPEGMVTRPGVKNINEELHQTMESLKIKHYFFNDKYDGIKLTKREVECLSLYLKGKTSHEIANHLSLNKKTIDTFLTLIKKKFDCRTRSELFEVVWDLGILKSNGWITV